MKKRKKNNAILIAIILMLVITLVLTRGFTYARYASNAVFNYYLSSQGFYFDSDDLAYDTKNNVDTMWDGEKVYFTLNNSANEALASETDIVYEVNCSIEEENTSKKCLVNGTDSNLYKGTLSATFACSDGVSEDKITCESYDKEWYAKGSSSKLYFEVVDESGDEVLSANVKLVVTALKPYKKELSATYNLIKDTSEIGDLSMKYEKGSMKSSLIVTNSYNENKCVLVSWNSNDFVYDLNSNDSLETKYDSDGNINQVYFYINKLDSIAIDFFERDLSASYSELNFNLVESNICQ